MAMLAERLQMEIPMPRDVAVEAAQKPKSGSKAQRSTHQGSGTGQDVKG